MREVRRLEIHEIIDFVKISSNAYPFMRVHSEEDRRKMEERLAKAQNENPIAKLYGLFEEGKMLGGMRYFDFNMTLHRSRIRAGGVGFVAVDLRHKKEKVARDMIHAYLNHYRSNGVNMCTLYPFRPDFYKKMGFGFGTKMNQYRIKPGNLPKRAEKVHLDFLDVADKPKIMACYNRFAASRNGMIDKYQHEIDGMFNMPENRMIGYRLGDEIKGYLVFEFKPEKEGAPQPNNLHVKEFIYESREVFLELLAFLNSQDDQINRVIINTQDENFHHLLQDPRNGTDNMIPFVSHESNLQGVGIMYRVVNVEGIFKELADHNFGGENCRVKLTVTDDFLRSNNKSVIVNFNGERVNITDDEYEVEVKMHISDFSSMLVGAVSFKALYNYGLAEISSEEYLDRVDKIFHAEEKPICMTAF